MQRIAQLPLKPTAIHPVIRLEMANRRFHRLSSLEPSALLPGQRLVLAAMNDLHPRIVTIHAAKAQINHDFLWLAPDIFEQDARLLELRRENVTIVRVAGKGPCPNHQAAFVGHGDTGLDAELVGLAGFALADALNFRCMQGVQLVFVLGLLLADALGTLKQRVQMGDCIRGFAGCACQFAFDFAQHNAEDGALALDGAAQSLELLGVGIAAGFAAQLLAFFYESLFQGNECRRASRLAPPWPGQSPASGYRPDGRWLSLGCARQGALTWR